MKKGALVPTFSMRSVVYSDGSYGVELILSGLTSERQAEEAISLMQEAFCGQEIGEH